jgi:hypothetical protein
MKKNFLRTLAVAAVVSAASLPSYAATLDFTGLPFSNTNPLVLSNATLTNLTGGSIFVGAGAAGFADGFCFAGAGCAADGKILFSNAVTNLGFDVDGWESGDSVSITAFNGALAVGTILSEANEHLDFSSFGAITSLMFDDSSTSAGVGYSTFAFDAGGNNVPEPGSLALALLGLVAAVRCRKVLK